MKHARLWTTVCAGLIWMSAVFPQEAPPIEENSPENSAATLKSASRATNKKDFSRERYELGTRFNGETGDNTPFVNLVWFYSENWSSYLTGVYADSQFSEDVDGFTGKNTTELEQTNLRLNILTWQPNLDGFQPKLGASGEHRRVNRTEFGYLVLPDALGGDTVAFENKGNIRAWFPTLTTGFDYRLGALEIFTYLDYTPALYLDYKQDTFFRPIAGSASHSSTGFTGPAWNGSLEVYWNSDAWLTFFLRADYDVWQLDYEVKTLDFDSATSKFGYSKTRVEDSETNITASGNLVFNRWGVFGGLKPFVGFGWRQSVEKDEADDSADPQKENQFVYRFGLKYKPGMEI